MSDTAALSKVTGTNTNLETALGGPFGDAIRQNLHAPIVIGGLFKRDVNGTFLEVEEADAGGKLALTRTEGSPILNLECFALIALWKSKELSESDRLDVWLVRGLLFGAVP